MPLTVQNLEQLQAEHPDWQLELVDGNIVVMGPSDYTSDEIGSRLITFLNIWVMPRNLGRVTGAAAGFILPNTDLRAPDVSFVSAERLRRSPRDFARLVPDLIVEIKSKSDRLKPLQEKINLFLQLGASVGVFIDPDELTVTIYRATQETPTVLTNGDLLTIPELLPGLKIPISDLWPPVF